MKFLYTLCTSVSLQLGANKYLAFLYMKQEKH